MKRRLDKLEVWPEYHDTGHHQYKDFWFWHLRSAYNGKITCAGEPNGYSSKAKALAGWKSVVKAAGGTGLGNVEVVEA